MSQKRSRPLTLNFPPGFNTTNVERACRCAKPAVAVIAKHTVAVTIAVATTLSMGTPFPRIWACWLLKHSSEQAGGQENSLVQNGVVTRRRCARVACRFGAVLVG